MYFHLSPFKPDSETSQTCTNIFPPFSGRLQYTMDAIVIQCDTTMMLMVAKNRTTHVTLFHYLYTNSLLLTGPQIYFKSVWL